MIKTIIAAVALAATSTTAFANERVYNVKVFDHVKTIVESNGGGGTRCNNVEVPVYGQSGGASGGDVFGGMLLGGLLGKGVTNDDGGAAVGAILGGIIAADKKQGRRVQTGYRIERQCYQEEARSTYKEVYSHSTIRFFINGKRYVVDFQK